MFDLGKLRGLILDMDGVLWRGSSPIGNLATIFYEIRHLGLRIILATNNATRTPEEYAEKLSGFGVQIDPWYIINSAMATANYLKNHFPPGSDIFVMGEKSLTQVIESWGFTTTGKEPVAVVVALNRQMTYDALTKATLLIRRGIPFIGTNPDKTFPIPEGQAPGTGAILAALETATCVSPIIMGKPQPEMYFLALERLGTSPKETLVIGDRLETDIVGAQKAGCPAALVLSGVTSREVAQKWYPPPEFISKDLETLLHQIKSNA